MKIHQLKIWPQFFGPVLTGKKPFECRNNDRGFAVGDILHLREWKQEARVLETGDIIPGHYTHEQCFRRVTFILSDWEGLQPGFVVLGIEEAYVSRRQSPTGECFSVISGAVIPDGHLDVNCEDCFNGLSIEEYRANPELLGHWGGARDDEYLCPACERERRAAIDADIAQFLAERAAPTPMIDDFLGGTQSVMEVYEVAPVCRPMPQKSEAVQA